MKRRMKKLLFIITLLLACFAARAQKGYSLVSPSLDPAGDSLVFEQMRERMAAVRTSCGRPTVAVVLSGGGAKGAAHVGVLRRLEEKGIPVDMILGTSMGGLVGGLYSLGYRADFLDSLLRSFDWKLMLSPDRLRQVAPASALSRRPRTAGRFPGWPGGKSSGRMGERHQRGERSFPPHGGLSRFHLLHGPSHTLLLRLL